MKKNFFYYNLETQFENTGDLLINQVLIDQLSKFGIVVIDDRNTPREFLNALITNSNVITSSHLGIYENFTDYLLKRTHDGNTSYLVYVPGVLYRFGFVRALKSFKQIYRNYKLQRKGIRLMRIGISIKSLKHLNGFSEAINSRYFHAYLLRDRKSIEKAKNYNLSNIGYIPDLAWAYSPTCGIVKSDRSNTKLVVLSFRSNNFGGTHDPENMEKIIAAMDNLLLSLPYEKLAIKIAYQVSFDRQACIQIFDFFRNRYNVEIIDELLNIEKACSIYSSADIIFSNRLHVLLLGIVNKTLSVPLLNHYSNDKIIGIFKDNDLEETVLYYDNKNEINSKKITQIVLKKNAILEKYNFRVATNKVKLHEIIASVVS